MDLNNSIPTSSIVPRSKLCAWTAIWRDMIISGALSLDGLVVVAGGDCHNALVDGQKAAKIASTHYFFYPFDGELSYLDKQMIAFGQFLEGLEDSNVRANGLSQKLEKELSTVGNRIKSLKEEIVALDKMRVECRARTYDVFKLLVSSSDMQSDIAKMENDIKKVKKALSSVEKKHDAYRIALLGVPPIYPDFHSIAESFGLSVVFDELPYEFVRHSGTTIRGLAKSYSEYTFAREFDFRLNFLRKELEKRKIDGIIHYTQFACHHALEDEMLRACLDFPILTVQGDLPRRTPEQVKLRLEAFSEMLAKRR